MIIHTDTGELVTRGLFGSSEHAVVPIVTGTYREVGCRCGLRFGNRSLFMHEALDLAIRHVLDPAITPSQP
jgi:hypothetical protein